LAEFWLSIMVDPMRRDSDRLEAPRLLADRGWGKAAVYEPQEGDPLDLAVLEGAAEEFRAKILRLAEMHESEVPEGPSGPLVAPARPDTCPPTTESPRRRAFLHGP
jgi:hypothetical protein